MKSLFYLIRRYKLASACNLLGLVLALTGCYILATQFTYILSYNHGIKGYKHIYRIYIDGAFEEGEWAYTLPRPLIEKFKECPQVESVSYSNSYFDFRFDKEGSDINITSRSGNEETLTTMNAELVDGTLTIPHKRDGGIVIPASLAKAYFGQVMCVGQQMIRKEKEKGPLTVVGVYKDFPVNCDMENAVYYGLDDENIDNLNNWNYPVYIRTRSDVDEETFIANIRTIFKTFLQNNYSFSEKRQELADKLALVPLSQSYLNGHDPGTDKGDSTVLFILELAFVLLLIIALINYANFSMAQAPIRLRGVNTRKVMGESNLSLRLHLVSEGVCTSLVAFLLSLVVIYCINLWPSVGHYMLGTIAISDHLEVVMLLGLFSLLLGILATIYSAHYITSFQPAMALKGNFGLTPSGRFIRQLLVGVQLVLAFIMVIFVGIIYSQSHYIFTSDSGYQKDALLMSDVSNIEISQRSALRSELMQINGVENVTYIGTNIGMSDHFMQWQRGNGVKSFTFSVIPADCNTLSTLGIDLIEGRDFKESDAYVLLINEAMKKKYPDIEMDKPLYEGDLTVVGVCKNFRAFTTRIDNSQKPVAFIIFGKDGEWGDHNFNMYVRIATHTNKRELRNKVYEVVKRFAKTDDIPDICFQDDNLEKAYQNEMRFMQQMELSTLLAFVITIIGVFCLTMFETEYRRKEIGIRKVMGSSVGQVLQFFALRYTWPLLISFLIAAPVGYIVSEKWLQNFAERTPIHWWLFPATLLIVSTIVVLTVVVQSWRVATTNPIESIKTE